jgi:hypothetical protein
MSLTILTESPFVRCVISTFFVVFFLCFFCVNHPRCMCMYLKERKLFYKYFLNNQSILFRAIGAFLKNIFLTKFSFVACQSKRCLHAKTPSDDPGSLDCSKWRLMQLPANLKFSTNTSPRPMVSNLLVELMN